MLLTATVLITACGGEAGTAVPVAAGSDSSSATPEPGSASGGGAGSDGTYDKNRTVKLGLQVRVVNTYRAPKATDGTAIDVWAGSPATGGRRLATVAYGQVSPYFAPEVPDPMGQGVTGPAAPYTLSFYPAGATAESDELISQGEDAGPGQKLTFVVGPVDPTDTGARGGSVRVLADDIGSKPKPGGFTQVTLPKVPAGQAALLLDADALQGRAGLTGNSSGLTPSTTDGQCLRYFETDSSGMGYTGALHDMSSSSVDLFGGTQYLIYQVAPGSSVRVNQPKENQGIPAACGDRPVFGPFDSHLAAGQGKYAFLYGADLTSARVVVVPVG
ncbi:DUF4397 domain-containing protein [Nakamurella panacisegetis]|uniref:DUF4397 domain-containing protein n=1 Tax=Nakamurella panacisegetis TaxID=1090615 RepID=UPI0012FE7B33|nr:DUF4397 domain-containing protein [Nakamurella panacisegetis]